MVKTNEEIEQLEEKYTKENQTVLKNKLREKQRELDAHKKSKPKEVLKPEEKNSTVGIDIKNMQDEEEKLQAQLDENEEKLGQFALDITHLRKLDQMLNNLDKQVNSAKEKFDEIGVTLGVKFDQVVTYSTSKNLINRETQCFTGRKGNN